MMVNAHCEVAGGVCPGQYGCRMGRSVADEGVTIAQIQEAWSRGCITRALLIDVAAAFPSEARGCLLRKMRNAGLDECLVKWTALSETARCVCNVVFLSCC